MKQVFVLLLSAAWTLTAAQNYYQGLMDYLDNRLLAIEDRMQLWHDQNRQYHSEQQDFKKLTHELMEGLGRDYIALYKDLSGTEVRVDRAEKEMEYVETWTSPRACVHPEEKVLERGEWSLKESRVPEGEEHGWEEVKAEVSDCEDVIASIRSVKILKRAGGPKGVWTPDPKSSKVYLFNGTSGESLFQFKSVRDFFNSSGLHSSSSVKLGVEWTGYGSAVYSDHLYYVTHAEEVQVVKFDLTSGFITDIAMFPLASVSPVYSLNPETIADISVDDQGLWLLYASNEKEPNINLAKLDRQSLDIEQIWDTGCPRENAEAAFVACGTVYVVYNTRLPSRSRIQCVFDVNGMVVNEEAPLMYFPRRFGAHSSLKYNPEEKQLYGWDDGYQIIYRLTMKRKMMATQ
ncbi:olfactomedin-like protein 3B [Periophthalmus magnuspinnatus]|uniref:olfactomedin-like protein 3B n=1 Tax=Periophthalmus magnuspinnatus TaxID=409849 RepID=UPI0024366F82|nr:olfactomedin-like protein 3B [Periophthalmus magnuspinnatus]